MSAPFSDFESFIRYLRWNRANDSDNVGVVDGYEGSGKSTLGLTICRNVDPRFPMNHVLYDYRDWDAVYDPEINGQVYLADEGSNIFFNRDWNRRPNKRMVKCLQQVRQLNHTLVIAAPSIFRLDPYIREDRAQWRMYTYKVGGERGFAGLQWRVHDARKGESYWEDLWHTVRFKPLPKSISSAYRARKWEALRDAFPGVDVDDPEYQAAAAQLRGQPPSLRA